MKFDKIILDFDEVIVDTIDAILHTYVHDKFNSYINFKKVLDRMYNWDMMDVLPLWTIHQLNDCFGREEFFFNLGIKEGVYKFLEMCNDKNIKVLICTKGSNKNISLKAKFIQEHFPEIETIYMNMSGHGSDIGKQMIDMKGAIFVDDNENNLFSSNASEKICFGTYGFDKQWNENWTGLKVRNYDELTQMIFGE